MADRKELQKYFYSTEVQTRFASVVGERSAGSYITSVMAAVANEPKLLACSPQSIYISAIRAATLRLMVDPSLGHAYLVPFGNKCTLILGYRGLKELALRTNKYQYINVSPFYEGQTCELDPVTGFYDVDRRGKKSNTVIGWFGSFRLNNGYTQHLYMTVEEIHEHKEKYSKGWDRKDSAWKTDTAKMERKTVMIALLKEGPLNDDDRAALATAETDENGIDAPDPELVIDVEEAEPKSAEEEIASLGYETKPVVEGGVVKFATAKVAKMVRGGYFLDMNEAEEMLGMSCLPAGADEKAMERWCKEFKLRYYDGEKVMSARQAASQANQAYAEGEDE